MSLWRQLSRGLRALTHRTATDREVADEVQDYLDHAVAEHTAQGLSPDEALRAARLELGNVAGVREEVRSYGWENAVEVLGADLRYALRCLRTSPGFTAITVLTLALGVGATTAIFSALSPILFQPLPYPGADRIVAILEIGTDGSHRAGSFGMYRGLADGARSFEALAVLKPWQPTMTGADQPERFEGQQVSAGYFTVLGVSPRLGRAFTEAEDQLNGPNVVILGDRLWRRRFGGDPAIIGRQVTLDDNRYQVVGVMPSGFENVLAPSAELWAPMQYGSSQGRTWGHHLRTVGRLRAGVSLDQASQEVQALGRRVLDELHPVTYDPNTRFATTSLQGELTRGVRPGLLLILGAVTLLLVIACVNVTNLLLARSVQRRAEFALRAALGAVQGRLLRQVLTESLLLAAIGGLAGMVIAVLAVRGLVALSPPGLPRAGDIRVDATVLAFGLGLTTLIGLALAVIPARQAARSAPHEELQHGSRRMTGGHRRIRGALVVAEVALALVLLVSSGLLLRSLRRLFAVETGFDTAQLLTMQVQLSGHRFDDDSVARRFYAQALDAARRVPGVVAAGFTSQLPLSGDLDEYGAAFEATPTRKAESYGAYRYAVSPGYIEMLGIPLEAGRLFDERDREGAPPVALISESLARLRFPGQSPLGEHLRLGGSPDAPPYTIVGVVGDVKQVSLALSQSEAVYVPESQWHWADHAMSLVVRTRSPAATLAPALRQAIWAVDKDQAIVRVATMDELLAATAAERRFALVLFEVFALAALLLAAAGIYGVLSGSVVERTREIGVRSALGATPRGIIALVLRQGLGLTLLGVLIGLAVAVAASRAMVAMLFGVSRLDPVTYVGVIVLLGGVATLACLVPAWRAAKVDPAMTLRAE